MISSIDIQFPEVDELIGNWRHSTDSNAAKGVPPHVTLLFPWRKAPIEINDLEEVRAVAEQFSPFPILFTNLNHFENGTIFFEIKTNSILEKLMNDLFNAFPDTPPYEGKFDNPRPHLTVAKAGNDQLLMSNLINEIEDVICPNLPIKLVVEKVSVMEEQSDGRWKTREHILLRNPPL